MIKIPFSQLGQGSPFLFLFSKLLQYPKFPSKTMYHLMKLERKLRANVKLVEEMRMKLISEYATKGEDGAFVPMKDAEGNVQAGTFSVADEKQTEWSDAIQKFGNTEAEIELNPLSLDELKMHGFEISVQEALVLEPVLQFTE